MSLPDLSRLTVAIGVVDVGSPAALLDLTPELYEKIFRVGSLSKKEVGRLCTLNREFALLCNTPGFWRAALQSAGWLLEWAFAGVLEQHRQYKEFFFMLKDSIGERCLRHLLALTNESTIIRKNAFRMCLNLNISRLPPNLTTIDMDAFNGCTSLFFLVLPEGVTTIRSGAFRECRNLHISSLPPKLTTIGANAFQGCTNLELDGLPEGLTTIYGNAFNGCQNVWNNESVRRKILEIQELAFFI